jgi:hypothetical protein
MLELRPTCENCNKSLPPSSLEAMICTFECTFCATCVEKILGNVCPNCGGGFCPRPIRPTADWKGGNFLGAYPAARPSGTDLWMPKRTRNSPPQSGRLLRTSAEGARPASEGGAQNRDAGWFRGEISVLQSLRYRAEI